MKLNVVQSSSAAINSIYIIHDFLDDLSYLKSLEDSLEKYTLKDEMENSTNVKATMTEYEKLLGDEQFNKIHTKILETLAFIFTLRTPHPHEVLSFEMIDSWGMRHRKNNETVNHIHGSSFSGAFYVRVPSPTVMFFEDYFHSLELENNMLVLFPGFTKHAVEKYLGDIDRISMAFNIDIKKP